MTAARLAVGPRLRESKQVADLVAGQPVQYPLQRQAGLEAFDLTQNVCDQCVWVRSRSIVRGNCHLRVRPKRARRWQRLGRKNVERGARERSFLQRGQDIRIDLPGAAPGIDKVAPPRRTIALKPAQER